MNNNFSEISGGVCAPKGFKASGVHCGIRHNRTKNDIAMIFSEVPASAAAVYTQNLVKGAPLTVTKKNLEKSGGVAQAVICNSGNANTCNADGIEIAEKMCGLAAQALNIKPEYIAVGSTGVIGQPLNIEPIKKGIPELVKSLTDNESGSNLACEGIMTTDTIKKEIALEFEISGTKCKIGAIAKGSGMIHPNMATMLIFITTDTAIKSEILQCALSQVVPDTFNMISVDGDTSTNDMTVILANGLAGNKIISECGEDFKKFKAALNFICVKLCRLLAGDGEGATKLLECNVTGAKDIKTAKITAKSVICSTLFKAAMFGADANWGRVLCAIGYSGADVDVNKIDVAFESSAGKIEVCKNGAGVDFSEEIAKKVLTEREIKILISLNDGQENATAWGCDLTYDYVKINGDYRT